MKLCFVDMPGARWCWLYFLSTCPNTFELWHLFHAMWCLLQKLLQTFAFQACANMCSINSCVSRTLNAQHIILFFLLSCPLITNGPRFTTKYFLHYQSMWNASLLLGSTWEDGGIPKKGELWLMNWIIIIIINGLEFWCMPIQHQNNWVVWSTTERYMQKEMENPEVQAWETREYKDGALRNEQSCNSFGSFEATKFKPAITGKIGNLPLILKKCELTQVHNCICCEHASKCGSK